MPRHLSFFKRALLIQAFLAAACVWAGEPTPKVQVQALGPDADLAPFQKSPAYETHAAPSPKAPLPSPRERERLISRSGLSSALEGWDAVDRDVLFMRAQSLDWDRLKAHYPKLPPDALRSFQKLVAP